eukprot:TRINITY_DN2707_c0_g2_i2.p1 TRINITY_DN2707_c0_g2~~TRINITY_DN2707_c0_g2_i2.p1  ORF type:complete len:397 (+),score=109.42 TRINITY_DN2707_c0_g2_i2:88-1278(+)
MFPVLTHLSLSFFFFFFLMIRRPPRSTLSSSSAASDVYKRQGLVRQFHIEMLMAVAGIRDMINQTPGLDDLISDTSQIDLHEVELAYHRRMSQGAPGEGISPSLASTSKKNPSPGIGMSPGSVSSAQHIMETLRGISAKHSWFVAGAADLNGKHCWSSHPADDFMIRGPNYLQDRKKIQSTGALMPVVCVELLPCSEFKPNIGSHPKGFIQRVQKHDWGAGQSAPFIFCVQFFVPCSSPNNYMLNVYCAQDPTQKNSQPQMVLDRFMNGTTEEQDRKFKLIPRVAEGGWFVRKACGDPPTPAIMGTKVKQLCHKGQGYFEVDFDLGASSVAGGIVKIVLGPCKSLVVDLGFMVESQLADELPEKLLMAVRLSRLDLALANERKNPYESVAFNIGRR